MFQVRVSSGGRPTSARAGLEDHGAPRWLLLQRIGPSRFSGRFSVDSGFKMSGLPCLCRQVVRNVKW